MRFLNRLKGLKGSLANLGVAVDQDTFLEMLDVFDQVSKNFSDDPQTALRHATTAVHTALEERGLVAAPYLIRIRALPQLLDNPEVVARFAPGFAPEDASSVVKECLLRAAASARFNLTPKAFGYDIDDVLKRAAELEQTETDIEASCSPA